jgi:hypothetical protein
MPSTNINSHWGEEVAQCINFNQMSPRWHFVEGKVSIRPEESNMLSTVEYNFDI